MSEHIDPRFSSESIPIKGTIVLLAEPEAALVKPNGSLDKALIEHVARAAKVARFTGARKTSLEVLAPAGDLDRVLIVGLGDTKAWTDQNWVEIGGYIAGQLAARKVGSAAVVAATASGKLPPTSVAGLAFGADLRSYAFRKFKTKQARNGEASPEGLKQLTVHSESPKDAESLYRHHRAVAEGVFLARDLVNEPANTLGPIEFAERTAALSEAGLEVEVLDVPKMQELKMDALLSVGKGSARPSRMVVMQWFGAENRRAKPIAFIGKGVVFDTGGISIKPAKGMEDMKGDMAGAACVTGLMLTLARRRATVNAVGIIGIVENMPSGTAMRPGDIIGSMSGQTIEVLNTDAEGRLVLADALHYAQERFRPKAIIDLATLTGAIIVALGKEYAGLFSNNERLAGWLVEAGGAVGERLWRMPLDPAYDKEIDSKNADMKNIGGQYGGAITAAQFLKRFVGDLPWAHLDIAGVALASNRSETNESWSSGFGVRLLDQLVAEHYES
jgi:leucyl aminopeptidase